MKETVTLKGPSFSLCFRKTSAARQAGASSAQRLQGGLGVQAWEDNRHYQDNPTV